MPEFVANQGYLVRLRFSRVVLVTKTNIQAWQGCSLFISHPDIPLWSSEVPDWNEANDDADGGKANDATFYPSGDCQGHVANLIRWG